MNQFIIILLLTISSFNLRGQTLSIVNDPDGYTNIREGRGVDTKIIGRLNRGEIFYHDGLPTDVWLEVYHRESGTTGFAHRSRIVELKSLPRLGTKRAIPDGRVIENDTFYFKIVLKKFDKEDHSYERQDDKWIIKIDGYSPWGVDGDYPTVEIKSLQLKINGNLVDISAEAYADLYELDLSSLNIYLSGPDIYIVTSNSDGAGYYDLVWIVRDKQYAGRFLGVI